MASLSTAAVELLRSICILQDVQLITVLGHFCMHANTQHLQCDVSSWGAFSILQGRQDIKRPSCI